MGGYFENKVAAVTGAASGLGLGITESLLVDTHSWFYLFISSHTDAEVLIALPQHFRPVVAPGIERTTIIKDNSFYIYFLHFFLYQLVFCLRFCSSSYSA